MWVSALKTKEEISSQKDAEKGTKMFKAQKNFCAKMD